MIEPTTLSAVASLFMLLMAGYCLKKIHILKSEDSRVVNNIIIYLCMTSFLFVTAHDKPLTQQMIKSPIVVLAIEIALIGVAYCIGKLIKLDRKTLGAFMLACVFSNSGFMGFPLVTTLFDGNKEAILSAVILDLVITVFAISSIGVAIAIFFAGLKVSIKNCLEFLKSPMFYSAIIAIALKDVDMPDVIMTTLSYMAGATIPLAMISIGMSLSTSSIKGYVKPIVIVAVFKLVVYAACVWYILPYFGIDRIVYKVAIIECATPTGVLTGVVSEKYGCNHSFCAAAIFVTTLLSIFTIPIIFTLIS